MSTDLSLLVWLTDTEYGGGSFNGPNLAKTLRSLTAVQAASDATLEGYTVWGVVLHLMYWKHELAQALGAATGSAWALPDLPCEGQDFPALPETRTEEAWQQTLAELDAMHAAYVAVLKTFPAARLDEEMAWGCTFGEAIAWMTTHDTYHTAMIRNMGVPGLVVEQDEAPG
jgi:hypothetical protein